MNKEPATAGLGQRRAWDVLTVVAVTIAGLLAAAFALLTPPFQFNDEHGHFARAYQISSGQVIGRPDPKLPRSVLSAISSYPEGMTPGSAQRTSFGDLWGGAGDEYTDWVPIAHNSRLRYLRWGVLAYQVYSPVCYLPASGGVLAARVVGMSAIGMMYAARLMNVACFMCALAVALILAPDCRALIIAVALMPMSLQQAAAISADPVTIAFAMIGFAMILHTRLQPVTRRFLAVLFGITVLWIMCKNSVWAVPLFLLIPASQFRGNKKRWGYVAGVTVCGVIAILVWRHLTRDAFEEFRIAGLAVGIDMYANAGLFARHGLQVIHDVLRLKFVAGSFIGTFGWVFYEVRFRIEYLVLLLLTAVLERQMKPFTIADRIVLGITFVGALIQTYLMLFVIDGKVQNGHYSFWSAGVQGRYLIPYCLSGLLILKQPFAIHSRTLAPVVLSASALYGMFSLVVMARIYY